MQSINNIKLNVQTLKHVEVMLFYIILLLERHWRRYCVDLVSICCVNQIQFYGCLCNVYLLSPQNYM